MVAVLTSLAVPRVEPASLTGGAPIVVLAPHPDDESLGCGALLAHAFAHHGAQVICMTDGSGSHPGSQDWPPARLAAARRQELTAAVAHLGGTRDNVTWLGHPDGWLGAQDAEAVTQIVASICRARGAHHLFAPAPQDHHGDHKATVRIAERVTRVVPDLRLLHYPVWSRWDDPDLYQRIARHGPVALDPGPWRAAKSAAIEAHATQLGRVVQDDPTGFSMSPAFVEAFTDQPELYWSVS